MSSLIRIYTVSNLISIALLFESVDMSKFDNGSLFHKFRMTCVKVIRQFDKRSAQNNIITCIFITTTQLALFINL